MRCVALRRTAAFAPGMEPVLIEWDWRMQDGIGTERVAVSLRSRPSSGWSNRAMGCLADLRAKQVALTDETGSWMNLRSQWKHLAAAPGTTDDAWEALWRRTASPPPPDPVKEPGCQHRAHRLCQARRGRIVQPPTNPIPGRQCPAGRRNLRAGRARPIDADAATGSRGPAARGIHVSRGVVRRRPRLVRVL